MWPWRGSPPGRRLDMTLLIKNVELGGRPGLDVRIGDGRILEIGTNLPGEEQRFDGGGSALISGLVDQHIHLLATAARAETLALDKAAAPEAVAGALIRAAAMRPRGTWIRAAGYHESQSGPLTRQMLDAFAPDHPVRVEHQSGALWILNSRALEIVATDDAPPAVERDAAGRATGCVWRGEAWLKEKIGQAFPDLKSLGRRLCEQGVTGVMDATPSTDAGAADYLATAHRRGDLPQRLALMSRGELVAPADGAFEVGPVKFLLDDHDLPDLEDLACAITDAHAKGRSAAFHCVTYGELAFTLAALEIAGAVSGDRIEHCGLIPQEALPELTSKGLVVVTQSGFIRERGDRYWRDVELASHGDLYRCASLLRAGIRVVASSDAPYSALDPWSAMRTAQDRLTEAGRVIGPGEGVSAQTALSMWQGPLLDAGGPVRRIEIGGVADLCLLDRPIAGLLAAQVRATLIGGTVVYQAD